MSAPILIIPGLGGSGPEHWQSLWESRLPNATRVAQADWDKPDRAGWIAALDAAIAAAKQPPILVAHSLSCALVACWAALHRRPIHGALLVGPADVDSDTHTPDVAHVFRPMPMARLPFPTIVAASRDDPYVAFDRAEAFASAWGAELFDAGNAGHINTSAGYGEWPAGEKLMMWLLADAPMTRFNSSGSPKTNGTGNGEQRTKWAPLRAPSTILHSLKVGVEGFTPSRFGWGHLHLSNGRALLVSSVDTLVASSFECFSLKVEPGEAAINAAVRFTPLVDADVFVLIREEYVEPFNGDPTGYVGVPRTIQSAAVPGRVPPQALMSCRVAYGLLLESGNNQLVIAADSFPFNVQVTADNHRISELLDESEAVPVDTYIEQYGVQS